jgi:hypothetical protein
MENMQKPSTQAEALVFYIQKMDIEMIDLILDNDKTYQDFPKHLFVEKLEDVFEQFQNSKETELIGYAGFCDSKICPNACTGGYVFIGNKSKQKISLLIDAQGGKILDVFECSEFDIFDKNIDLSKYNTLYIEEDMF